jgi:hypothetical protein
VVAADPSDAFGNADAKQGDALVAKDCVACNARRFDGDADRIYTRAEHRVRNPEQLMAQILYCNTELGTGYFPDGEEDVAAYLNKRYYHFQ